MKVLCSNNCRLHATPVTNPKRQPGCVTPFSHSERGKCVGLDVEVRSTSSLTCNIPHKVLPDYTNAVLTHLHTPSMLKGHGTVGEHRYVHGNKRPSASPLLTCVLAEKLFQRTSPAIWKWLRRQYACTHRAPASFNPVMHIFPKGRERPNFQTCIRCFRRQV